MKIIALISAILAALLSLVVYITCVATPLFGESLSGSGKIISRTLSIPDFNSIDASRATKVVISDKINGQIRIEADDNLIDKVIAEVNEGELEISIDKSIKNITNTHITVTVPANGMIRSLEASSAASITSEVVLQATQFDADASSAAKINVSVQSDKCEIDASSAAKIEMQLQTVTCNVEVSSAAKVELSGSAEKCVADLNSASKLQAEKFVVANYTIDVSSGAYSSINCTEMLQADATSGGDIDYSGACQTSISKSSGGSVRAN